MNIQLLEFSIPNTNNAQIKKIYINFAGLE